ncbi:hypothetical protein [Thermoactinospora rubra]|uniref:amidohydrolase family protein n=1 Tax=Thermoactinospora rubra TaxID=1088767 RepID=UPI000A111911|nr:hypothetical protein [Thermoactinospora rubra]
MAAGRVLGTRATEPVVLHSAALVLPVRGDPVRDGAVAVRGSRVLRVGPVRDLLASCPVRDHVRWTGAIVAGLVDAFGQGPPAPGVTARASLGEASGVPGLVYLPVDCPGERAWEESERDALITAVREAEHPVGIAARSPDPLVLEDVAVLARTFGLRLLADLERHSPAVLDETGVLGPHCHVVCARQLDPGERKLLRLRRTVVAAVTPRAAGALLEDLLDGGDGFALGGGDPLALARHVRSGTAELDRRLVEAATLAGARALGMAEGRGRIGCLGPGSRADFAVFGIRGRVPYSELLEGAPCLATVTGGQVRSA